MEPEGLEGFNPEQQLDLLIKKSQILSPDLYRDSALYLQILRSELFAVVQKAIFELITDPELHWSGYNDDHTSQDFQIKIEQLVGRCKSLLTVEQLMNLGQQLHQEHKQKSEIAKQQILDVMKSSAADQQTSESSVQLSIAPPLDQPERLGDVLRIMEGSEGSVFEPKEFEQMGSADPGADQQDHSQSLQSQETNKEQLTSLSGNMGIDLDLLNSLLSRNEEVNKFGQSSFEFAEVKSGQHTGDQLKSKRGFLPETPVLLAQWMDDLEVALTRRLCNLSYAINVELLKAGLVNSLIPGTLLEAVLQGQVESQSAASNLLRLKVPISSPPSFDQGAELICVLLRSSEMEFNSPRLRRCRTLLKHHRSALLRMVQQQRHWQRRAMLKKTRNVWWQTSPGSH